MNLAGCFFQNQGTFLWNFKKGRRDLPPLLPSSYAPVTRFRLGLSHLSEHKFKYSFQDSLNALCKCGAEVESSSHFLLHYLIYDNNRSSLLSTIRNIDSKLLEITDTSLTQTLLYGNPSSDIITNSLSWNATIDFILSTKRFEEALF